MVKEILYIGAGGFIGSVLRYLISQLMKQTGNGFPWGTLVVNLLGCLLIGILGGLISRNWNISHNLALFLTVGLCGGFTTFSTFSKEALLLLQNGCYLSFIGYIATSVILGVLAVALGLWIIK